MSDFWSSRKARVAEEEAREARAARELERQAKESALEEKPDEEILEELGLPDPDTLGEGDDFKQFLTQAVPARIRQRALRKLWRTNPLLANVDGLVDYGEDFTDAGVGAGVVQTAYQVGKGMMKHIEEVARQAEADAAAEAAPEPEEREPQQDEEMVAEAPRERAPAPVYIAPEDAPEDSEDVAQPAPIRRMRFEFDERADA